AVGGERDIVGSGRDRHGGKRFEKFRSRDVEGDEKIRELRRRDEALSRRRRREAYEPGRGTWSIRDEGSTSGWIVFGDLCTAEARRVDTTAHRVDGEGVRPRDEHVGLFERFEIRCPEDTKRRGRTRRAYRPAHIRPIASRIEDDHAGRLEARSSDELVVAA